MRLLGSFFRMSFYNCTRVFLSVNSTCTFILYFKLLPKYVGNHYRKNVNGRKITTIVSLFQRIFRLSNDLKGYLQSIKKLKKRSFWRKNSFVPLVSEMVFSEITLMWWMIRILTLAALKVKTHKTFFKPNNSGHLIISFEPMKNCFQVGWAPLYDPLSP